MQCVHNNVLSNLNSIYSRSKFYNLTCIFVTECEWSFKWNGDEVVINFGKNAGRTLRDIAENDPGFLRWILRGDFADDVKEIASNALIGKFPSRSNE